MPPQVSYQLTELGHSLAEQLGGVVGWIGDNVGAVLQAQHDYDTDAASPASAASARDPFVGVPSPDNAGLWLARISP